MPSPAQVEDVRLAVYTAFAETGRAPEMTRMSAVTGLPSAQIHAALQILHEQRDLVVGEEDAVVMAHPFAAIPLGFSVMGERTLWWGGCAWDSFAIAHLLTGEPSVLVATTCPACDAAHAFDVNRDAPPTGDQVAHFLTPMAKAWNDVVHTCAHQRIFCSDGCVQDWLLRTGNVRGYVLDLGTLWRLARGWYAGRLERGYRRREPIEAASYFASVGLAGPFWGLPQDASSQVAAAG